MAKKFPDKTPGETKLCTFDFASEMAAGATLSNPEVTKTVVSGTDPDAVGLTLGTPAVSGSTLKVLVSGGVEGVRYQLLAQVDADNGEVHQLSATITTKASAA